MLGEQDSVGWSLTHRRLTARTGRMAELEGIFKRGNNAIGCGSGGNDVLHGGVAG